jgi:hypothetical protein
MTYRAQLAALLAVGLLVAACAGDGAMSPAPSPASPGPEAASPVPEPGGFPGEYSDAILADAEERIGQPQEALTVRRATEVIWADESLECPQAGQTPQPTLIPGYQMIVEYLEPGADRILLDYRVRSDGSFELCEEALPEPT